MLWFIIYIASLITSLVTSANAEEGGASQAAAQEPKTTALAPALITAVKQFEGCSPRAFWDYGQYSIGYGTRAVSRDETIDCEMEAEQRLVAELGQAQTQVDALGAPLTAGQRAALTSLTFNAGASWMHSGLGEAVRAGDWIRARAAFLQYVRANGQVLEGLVRRRRAEAAWFEDDLAGQLPAGEVAASVATMEVRLGATLNADTYARPYLVIKTKQVKAASRHKQSHDDRLHRRRRRLEAEYRGTKTSHRSSRSS